MTGSSGMLPGSDWQSLAKSCQSFQASQLFHVLLMINPDFFCNKKVWRSWVQAVHNLVADWAGFDYWSWAQFSNMTTMRINKLLGPDLEKFTVCLLAFFIHSFVQHLGYYPSPLPHPPTFTGHTCTDHQKKFGYGVYNLPLSITKLP